MVYKPVSNKEERNRVDRFDSNKMNHDEIIRGRYRKIAAVYDKSRFGSIQQKIVDKRQKNALFRSLKGLQKDSKILEVGCGTGRFLEFLEDKGYTNLHGIDQAEEMLKIAEKRCHATLIRGDAFNFAFKKNSFDAVYSVRVLMHLEKPEEVINEMLRVGKIVIFDLVNKDSLSYIALRLMGKETPSEWNPKSFRIRDVENKLKGKIGFKNDLEIIPVHCLPINVHFPQFYFRYFDFFDGIISKIYPRRIAPQVFIKIVKTTY